MSDHFGALCIKGLSIVKLYEENEYLYFPKVKPVDICLFKVSNENTRIMREIIMFKASNRDTRTTSLA